MKGYADMSEDKRWQFELGEYIKQGEPEQIEKSDAWKTAIGLQAVDGLKTSAYLLDTAKAHIEGKISIDEAQKRIQTYYEESGSRTEDEEETREADIVSARIAKILGEKTFQFSPAEWLAIHRHLFEGVFDYAGRVRKYNITKKEWVLKGDTVLYAPWSSVKETLDYDFKTEKQFSYEGLSQAETVKHLVKFTADIWQIHPFCEGNTRATAVFIIKYMKKRRIKWGNIGVLAMFIICGLLVINDFIILATSTASLTYYGAITLILALIVMSFCGEYLYEEMQ